MNDAARFQYECEWEEWAMQLDECLTYEEYVQQMQMVGDEDEHSNPAK